ncbi:NAD dependent epimerase/dehydratase [Colletotrichum camelliae]|nr:NAD dependent epimerase/dehydratase [Colletotrichum camelliae]
MSTQMPKILLLGATGYIGGSVLYHLLNHPSLTSVITITNPITTPMRGSPDRLAKLTENYGSRVKPTLISSLDDVDAITKIASEHDIVINAGSGFHPPSAKGVVPGLAKRKAEAGAPVWAIHTSGCSNISDNPVTGPGRPDVEHDDANSDKVFAFEEAENENEWYPQRASEIAVLRTGDDLGVSAVSIQAPIIFGTGTGLFQQAGLMIPLTMAFVLERGYGFRCGDGTGVFDWVQIEDLADLYVLCVLDIIQTRGDHIPTGKKGIIFPAVGRALATDVTKKCLDMAFATGILPKEGTPQAKEICQLSLKDAEATLAAGNVAVTEKTYAGHRKMKGTVARRDLGWTPIIWTRRERCTLIQSSELLWMDRGCLLVTTRKQG